MVGGTDPYLWTKRGRTRYMSGRKINFGAGPAKIPDEVLLKARDELTNFAGTGISILEMSHRSKEFAEVLEETKDLLRQLMNIPEEFEILFMQGGGTGQFAAIPLNIKGNKEFADYIVTGTWSSKAAAEGSKYIKVKKHGIVFGGTQKNLGAAGLTVVMVRKDLISEPQPITPAIFSYKEMHDNNSLYNTPAVYGIYITNLVLKWIRDNGGVDAIFEMNKKKSSMIYDLIDSSDGFYNCAVDKKCRSYMNIVFRIKDGDEKLEADFLKGALARGMISLKGHRSVGGIRASLYNAVSLEETAVLADWMREFMTTQAA
ncbi:hypothetical protein ANCCEY_06197 [Ancylostoma ceylanicum]|uniref:phosphoserine transaminase n=1 Tax=Ancylostoma ceylanicum TaxID=53326 RepID=A0A0D6LS37_9BILA|nr:hypothetical protein ANCCEY_06197 [Ancylostoma ceylanicum]